jgi:hypothetical protein
MNVKVNTHYTCRQTSCIGPIITTAIANSKHCVTHHERGLLSDLPNCNISSNAINSQASPTPTPSPRNLNRRPLPRRNPLNILQSNSSNGIQQ